MNYLHILWIIFGGVILNTWKNIIILNWRLTFGKNKRELAHAACGG